MVGDWGLKRDTLAYSETAEKAWRMLRDLRATGFASFA
jgi:hypothetical protein